MGRLEAKVFTQDRLSRKRIDDELNEFLREHPGYKVQCISYIGDVCSTKRELFVLFEVHDTISPQEAKEALYGMTDDLK